MLIQGLHQDYVGFLPAKQEGYRLTLSHSHSSIVQIFGELLNNVEVEAATQGQGGPSRISLGHA